MKYRLLPLTSLLPFSALSLLNMLNMLSMLRLPRLLSVWSMLSVLGALACSRPEPVMTSPHPVDPRDRYIRASIEIGCQSRTVTEPQRLANLTWALYQKYGFETPESYLEQVTTVGKEEAVHKAIQEGLARCR